MNPNKALWEKGDFTEIAAFMRESGEAVAEISRDNASAAGLGPRLRRRHHGCSAGPAGS